MLRLVPLSVQHAETLYRFYADADAMKYRGSSPMQDPAEALQMIDRANKTPNAQRWGLELLESGQLVGTLLIKQELQEPRRAEIGFSLGREYWGKGLGHRALQLAEQHLMGQAETITFYAWCVKENHASVRIFEKAGYQRMPQSTHPNSWLFERRIP